MTSKLLLLVLSVIFLQLSLGFVVSPVSKIIQNVQSSNTRLFAHHPQKKAIKRTMHKRPKKTRASDIIRSNVNYNLAIEQLPEFQAVADYTVVSYEQYLKDKAKIEKGYEEGDPNVPWEAYTEEDLVPLFNRNRKQLDKSELKKISKHPLWRNRDQNRYPYDQLNEKTQKIISEFEAKLIHVEDFNNIPREPNYKRKSENN